MHTRILGSFQLEEGGRRIALGGVRQRAVLVSLLLHANEVVPSEQLLMDLWGEDSPLSAANSLQAAISRLRRVLPPGRLITRAPGYALRIFPEELDVSQFEQLVSEGREALTAGAAEEAARTLRQALSLWQGPALADFRYEPFAQAEIVRLEELHLTCLEERVEADLALGLANVLVAELGRLVSEHPLRERLRGQLMLALYRDGRQTEALEIYRDFRSVLRDELGLDPSPQLRELETAILRQDTLVSPVSTAAGAPLARGPVTVVCILLRVASTSGLALDPEAYEVVNEQSVSDLTAVLERYGGKLAITADERLIGVFGAASVHEDDALRAVRASLEARRVLSSEMADMLRRFGVSLTYRFGVATGEALVGGSVPLGSAGNVSAQAVILAESAEPGQILISGQTQELAAAAIDTERAGPDRFILQSAQAAMRPLALRLDVPLVGRDEELRQLAAACAAASQEQATTLVTVIGEAGIGKTRLVYEIERQHAHEMTVLTGRCLPYGEGITFWPLREVILQAGGGHDSPDKIKVLLDGQADAAEVAARLSLAIGPGNQGRLDGAEIFWAARRLLETLARSRPLLIVFEDLHWAESTFLDLVESLAVQQGRSPVVLVCVARPELLEQRPAWAAGIEGARSIELTPLADGSAAALLYSLTGDQNLPPSTQARLLETAAGNPLYLEQLAASLSEQAGSEIWPVLPPTIQALLGARLQRLGPGASSVLARAAIVGKDFGVQAVRELLPPEARGPLSRNLQTLVAKRLVQHEPLDRRPGEEYSFRHILIQEAAYRAIPKSLRAELHHRFADWLEYVFWEPATQRPEILGYHLEQSVRYLSELRPAEAQSSPLPRRAASHLETAGRAAHDRDDAIAAVNLLVRAASLLPRDDAALARLYTTLGAALTEAGQLQKAMTTLDDAQRVAAANGDERQCAHARAQALMSGLELDPHNAAEEIAQALPGLRSQFARGPDELGLCRVLQLQAAMHWIHARSAAAEEAWQRAAEYARRVNDRRQLAEILGWLASAALWGPTPAAEGIRRCQDCLDEIGNHPRGQAVILWHMAGLYAMQDRVAVAQTTLSRAKSHAEILGPTMTATGTQPAAFIAMLAGDPVSAEMHLRLGYESLSRMGEKGFLSITAALLAKAIVAQGEKRYTEASELIEISREAAGGEDLSAQILGQGLSARILADSGSHAEAVALASSAVALAAQTDLVSQHADALLDLAHTLATSGRVAEAQAAATQALDLYQRKGNLPGARESLGYLAQYAHTREDLLMPYSAVPSITLNQDGTITLEVNVYGFKAGTPVEISGQATQTNGAVATFYSVQEMPASSGLLKVGPVQAAPGITFVAGFPITVVARAAEAWITTLDADPGSEDPGGFQVRAASADSQDQAASDTLTAAWKQNSAYWAVAPSAPQSSPAPQPQPQPVTTLLRHGTGWDRIKGDPLDAVMGGLPVDRMDLIGGRIMSDMQLELAFSLPSGFRFGEVSSATAFRDRVSSVPSLGPLTAFTGTFHGNGFNTIFRPDQGSPTPLPIPATGDNLLELNLTRETLSFSPALGSVPNRGEVQPDAFLNGVPYLQVIQDVTVPSQPVGIHFEPGLWMSMPKTTDPNVPQPTVFRMASIPHGTTIEAQGTFSTINGKPNIKPVDITPFLIGQPGKKVPFPSQKVVNGATPRIPQDLTSFAVVGTITQAMLDDPNTLLRSHIASQNITSTTVILISTQPTAPLFGGGTDNIAFLLGDPQSTNPNANAVEMEAAFWIETVEYTFEVPIFQPGQPPLIIPAETGSAGQPVPEFLVNPPIPITTPRQIKVPATQIQYSQRVLLNFNHLSCPHVSVATLVPASPIPVPPSVWA